jgi:hypothetical protein
MDNPPQKKKVMFSVVFFPVFTVFLGIGLGGFNSTLTIAFREECIQNAFLAKSKIHDPLKTP